MDKKKQAEQDYRDGWTYWEGYDTEQDFDRAEACLKRAAEAGHIQAMRDLALLYYYAFEDDQAALYWARRMAETPDASNDAQRLLARFGAPPPHRDEYYRALLHTVCSYDHVVHSDLSCGWRSAISLARTCTRKVAEALRLHGDKAEALAVLRGRTLLPFGPSGAAYIRTLAMRDRTEFDHAALCLANVRDAFAQPAHTSLRMTDDLRNAIAVLYHKDEAAWEAQKESRIAAAVYDMLLARMYANEHGEITEAEWEEQCRAAVRASVQGGELSMYAAMAQTAQRYADNPPSLPDAEREFLDIVWAHYRKWGAEGTDLIRRVTASFDQGMRVADFRRVGRRTPDGQRIHTYTGSKAPRGYRLKIRVRTLHTDLTYRQKEVYEKTKSLPLRLGGHISIDGLTIDVAELLCTHSGFAGAVLDVSHPSDARSLTQHVRRETLLTGQSQEYGFGGGSDDFDLSRNFCVTIEKTGPSP